MSANDKQVGGDHYEKDGEQHWDRMWRLYGRGYFIGNITKYVERYHVKNGKQDLEKAMHYLEKLKELEYGGLTPGDVLKAYEKKMGPTLLGDALREPHYEGIEDWPAARDGYWKEDLDIIAKRVQARTDKMIADQKAQGVNRETRTLEELANGIKKQKCTCGAITRGGPHTPLCDWNKYGEAGRNYVDQ